MKTNIFLYCILGFIITMVFTTCGDGNSSSGGGGGGGNKNPPQSGSGNTHTGNYMLSVREGENIIRKGEESDGEEVQLTGISWDGTTKTLTLNNFSFTTSDFMALYLVDGGTIELNGTNTLKSTFNNSTRNQSYGIFTANNLTIQGSGSLTVTAGTVAESFGIHTLDSALTISSATVNAQGGTASGAYGYSVGIYLENYLTTNSSVTITNGATITATGAAASFFSVGIAIASIIGDGEEVLNLVNGTVTTTGLTYAIFNGSSFNRFYTVPNGIRYWVNTTTANPGGAGTVSDGSFVINDTHKYARLQKL